MKPQVTLSQEVEHALNAGLPIVALESTIIAHGMPYPQNLETATKVEQVIRDGGAIPATVAVLDGVMHAGLTSTQLEHLANAKDVLKLSRRDLPFAISQKTNGATTVASTMIVASFAGIKIFATGGIGGVHRGAETTWDVSADLTELGKTDVAVVSAGAKAILDIPKTLEVLETLGVPVLGYKCKDFPAFYSVSSGSTVDYNMQSPEEIAHFIYTKWDMGLKGGVLVANPVPVADALPIDVMEGAIKAAIDEAESNEIHGKELTPFLLSRIKELTQGHSLASNISLVLNNAKLGAQIACAYSQLIGDQRGE